jgi:hypothetical protein
MRNKWIGSILALAGATGMALAQSPPPGDAPVPGVSQVSAVMPQAPAGGCAEGGCAASGAGWWQGGTRDGVSDNVLYARAEYLLWFFKSNNPRVLVGTVPGSVVTANPVNLPPGSIVPLVGGGAHIDNNGQSGARLGLGVWLDPGHCCGVEVEGFWIERGSFHANFASNGDPVIGPVYNDLTRETIILFADPNLRRATMNVDANNRLWGAELNARARCCSIMSDRLDVFAGFRYLSFDESVNVSGTTTALPNTNGFDFSYFDSFGVHNQFYGGQIGLQSDFACGRWFLNIKGKLALGDMHETARLDGSTTVTEHGPGALPPFTLPGGVLVQPSNMGHFRRDRFAVIPELTINTGVQVTDHMRVFVGYNFLYVDHLARAAHQTDGVDSSQIPVLNPTNRNLNATRPQFDFNDGRFWVNGLNVGMEVRY